jgi:hypothetical protein
MLSTHQSPPLPGKCVTQHLLLAAFMRNSAVGEINALCEI